MLADADQAEDVVQETLLALHGRLNRMDAATIRKRSGEVLELVGLSDAANQAISGYSKGMRQRLGLAHALLNTPELIFLDEPTSALDPLGRRTVRGIILFMLYGLAFIGSRVEQIETLFQASAAEQIGIVSSLLLPVEALWRLAAYALQPQILTSPRQPSSGLMTDAYDGCL